MASERFPARFRLRKTAEFQRVFSRRCTASDSLLLIYACDNGLDFPRVGLSVSRKVGNAVRRNRWKRLMREAFRLSRESLPSGIDLLLIPRPDAEPTLATMKSSLVRLASRAASKLTKK